MSFTHTVVGSTLLALGAISLIDVASPGAPRLHLSLERLDYADGIVTQQLSGDIEARWSANISRLVDGGLVILCEGHGTEPGIYRGEITPYSPSEWTGGDCPPLESGDVGEASWTYLNEHGLRIIITGHFTVS